MTAEQMMQHMVGKTLTSIVGCEKGSDQMTLWADNHALSFLYEDDWGSCRIEDVAGDPNDLLGTPLLMCEAVDAEGPEVEDSVESHTWTFYKFATVKGYLTVRWFGESNGYYSETVTLFLNGERAR